MEGLPHYYIDGAMIPHKGDLPVADIIAMPDKGDKRSMYQVSEPGNGGKI